MCRPDDFIHDEPCRNFAPDSLGDDPTVCIACLCNAVSHGDAFAKGYVVGYYDDPIPLEFQPPQTAAVADAFSRGLGQGDRDYRRRMMA